MADDVNDNAHKQPESSLHRHLAHQAHLQTCFFFFVRVFFSLTFWCHPKTRYPSTRWILSHFFCVHNWILFIIYVIISTKAQEQKFHSEAHTKKFFLVRVKTGLIGWELKYSLVLRVTGILTELKLKLVNEARRFLLGCKYFLFLYELFVCLFVMSKKSWSC